jgi:hypothetical protein
MSFVHGKNAYLQLDSGAGSLVDLSTYIDDISFPEEISADETTTFGAGSKTYTVGLADAKLSVSGKYDAALDAHMSGVLTAQKAGTLASASFVFGPSGSTTPGPKYTGEAILTSFEVSPKVSDVITWKADLQVTGAVTRSTF